jgi:anti-sigma B factor antagonist
MKLTNRQVGNVAVLDISGRIVLGEDTALLRSSVRDLCAKNQKNILLNLANATHIDSSGLGELVTSCASVRKQGGEMKLLKLTQKVHDVLQVTKLYTVFDIYDDEATAIKSFTK